MVDLSPPPIDIREQIFASEQDAYAKQGRWLRYSVATNGFLSLCVVGALGVAGWAITKERDHVRLVAQDELGIYHVLNVTPKAMTSGERIVVADRWIRDVMETTTDISANQRMRNAAVLRLNLSAEEKDKIIERAYADLETQHGFAVSVGQIDFKEKGNEGLAYDATFTLTTTDMRGTTHPEPTKVEWYVADIQFVEVDPTPAIPDGLLIAPFEPRKLTDVPGKIEIVK